jgi:hypothetical protein
VDQDDPWQGLFVYFRIHEPQQSVFDGSCQLLDVQALD